MASGVACSSFTIQSIHISWASLYNPTNMLVAALRLLVVFVWIHFSVCILDAFKLHLVSSFHVKCKHAKCILILWILISLISISYAAFNYICFVHSPEVIYLAVSGGSWCPCGADERSHKHQFFFYLHIRQRCIMKRMVVLQISHCKLDCIHTFPRKQNWEWHFKCWTVAICDSPWCIKQQ